MSRHLFIAKELISTIGLIVNKSKKKLESWNDPIIPSNPKMNKIVCDEISLQILDLANKLLKTDFNIKED